MSIFSKALANNFIAMQLELKPTVSIEVGAREAAFSHAMKWAAGARVFAFEANPYSYEHFRDAFTHEEYLNLAVSNTNDLIELKFAGEDKLGGAHSIHERSSRVEAGSVSVQSVTLDDYILPKISSGDRIAMWIDVEGAQREVFSGAHSVLDHTDSIFIEVEHKQFWEGQMLADEVARYLKTRGFSFLARDYEWFPPDEDYPLQENYVFVRTSLLHS